MPQWRHKRNHVIQCRCHNTHSSDTPASRESSMEQDVLYTQAHKIDISSISTDVISISKPIHGGVKKTVGWSRSCWPLRWLPASSKAGALELVSKFKGFLEPISLYSPIQKWVILRKTVKKGGSKLDIYISPISIFLFGTDINSMYTEYTLASYLFCFKLTLYSSRFLFYNAPNVSILENLPPPPLPDNKWLLFLEWSINGCHIMINCCLH